MSQGFFRGVGELGSGGLDPAVESPAASQWVELIYDDLSQLDQKILEWTLGFNGKPVLSNQEIARRLGRSPGAISQRKLAIQQLLNQEQELSPF
jgi:hypothetical protein